MLNLRSMLSRLTIRPQTFYQPIQCIHVSEVDCRARKGTRERREKLKKKNKTEKLAKITKVGYIPPSKRNQKRVDKHITDECKETPTDDAYPGRYYRLMPYRLVDAIQNHKDLHDPTMYDVPNAMLHLTVEMDMVGDKPTRLVSNFQKLVDIKYPFDHGQTRSILVFAKDEVNRSDAMRAGATTVGGSDLVKMALKGNIRFADYQFILAHPDIMPEMLALRGLLKRKFPSQKTETLGIDMTALVSKFMSGLFVSGKRDEFQENFGLVQTDIGRLDMPTEHLAENFKSILTTINDQRPNRGGKFITRAHLTTDIADESFSVDPVDFPFADYERPVDASKVKAPPTKHVKINPNQLPRVYTLFRTPIETTN